MCLGGSQSFCTPQDAHDVDIEACDNTRVLGFLKHASYVSADMLF